MMTPTPPHILLVNPWIHDFAAFDFWAKPMGLLTLAAILRLHGCRVSYIDCLDRFHPCAPPTDPLARNGRGAYLKTRLCRPPGLGDIPRRYSRYGIRPAWLRQDLAALSPPDLILVSGIMTYWYPGVVETIAALKTAFPTVPVILGGIYATLCPEHAARCCGADRVLAGPGDGRVLDLVAEFTGFSPERRFDPDQLDSTPYPAFDLQRQVPYVCLLTSRGCPFDCAYCAARYLQSGCRRRHPGAVVAEIRHWHDEFGVREFVFYDDALLTNSAAHFRPIMEGVIRAGLAVRFHTPNAVHIREINDATADLMIRAGFETLRLGLETTAFEARGQMDHKVTAKDFQRAVGCLKRAGFDARRMGAYLLAGLPGQPLAAVVRSIQTVKEAGITPVLAYYSPIPHTAMWPAAVASSRYDLAADPIFTNNAIFPCQKAPFSWERLSFLKNLAAA
jgi:radical SAM superfamily enzyme YgiQ (UPF0313 family)